MEKRARFQSAKSSNAIEGIVTTDERIYAIVNQNSVPLNQTEEEIAGYRDALNVVHSSYQSLSVNEDTLLNLHRILLQRAKPDAKGHYKTEDNVIMEVRSDGTRSVCFRPVPVKETKNAME